MTHGTGDTVHGVGSLGITAGGPDHHPMCAANLLDIARLARMRKAVGLALQPGIKSYPVQPSSPIKVAIAPLIYSAAAL